MRKEIDYYDEIKTFIEAQIKSNFTIASSRTLHVYWGIGELKSCLKQIISEHSIECSCAAEFAELTPPLSLDIFALITDGAKFELLIIEVKNIKSAGLSEWSQLVGYCLVSSAKYGLLINIDSGESPRLTQMLATERHISYINTVVDNEKREHCLGFMQWDSLTRKIKYSNRGEIKSLPELSKRLIADFE